MEANPTIAEFKERFPEGSIVKGVVARHVSFGFFANLGVFEFDGLVRITDITDDPPVTEADRPPVGSEIDLYVWDVIQYPNTRPQVILSIRPSILQGAV